MNEKINTTLSRIKDYFGGINFTIEYDEGFDMYFINHDIVDDDFTNDDAIEINKILYENLDLNGIINYSFGYDESVDNNKANIYLNSVRNLSNNHSLIYPNKNRVEFNITGNKIDSNSGKNSEAA